MVQDEKHTKRESVIDDTLKRVYDETLQEGVPDRFRDLLAALKAQDAQKDPTK